MIRSELVQLLSESNPGLTARELDQIVSKFFDQITAQLAIGGRVELRGFGTFATRDREEREGRNPRTGSTVAVSAKKVPHFRPGKDMRDRING
jgi:integration host factor subunit beta